MPIQSQLTLNTTKKKASEKLELTYSILTIHANIQSNTTIQLLNTHTIVEIKS